MLLQDFVREYICPNTMIRLWIPEETHHGHRLLINKDTNEEVGMSWQITNPNKLGWQAKYADKNVIGVNDILCETYKEAVNIVIQL